MVEWAYAQAAGGAPAGGGGIFGQINMLIPFIAMFAIFYFLLIRPQQKKQRELRQMLQNLKRGDRVITSGGIYGTIVKSATISFISRSPTKSVFASIRAPLPIWSRRRIKCSRR